MSTTAPLPKKEDLQKQLWDVATTLTPEAQNAALKKAVELGFDLQRGRIPLEESLINLNHAREVLLDAVENNKLTQLPLKLQYSLFTQTQRVGQALSALINGSDTVLALEDSVDDLTSSIWQYNLQNLSGEVLGFTQKMNQLKSQETEIRQARREAQAFTTVRAQAEDIAARLVEEDARARELSQNIASAAENSDVLVTEIAGYRDATKSKLAEVEQMGQSASVHLQTSEAGASRMSSLVAESEQAKNGIEETRQSFSSLLTQATAEFEEIKTAANDLSAELRKELQEIAVATRAQAEATTSELRDSITALHDSTQAELQTATSDLQKATEELRTEVADLASSTDTRLKAAEENQSKLLRQAIDTFSTQTTLKLDEVSAEFRGRATEIEAEARKSVADNDAELHRLTSELESLELRIRDSIERATGYTLFHSFQKRQEDLAKEKQFWARALAVAVGVSLIASGAFIFSLRYVHVYDAAFYLKLSISLPIIYAIGFCSVQYSRERRLEEEYAFKSNISISLDPYQRLVKQLVDANSPEELAKYTAFVIDSVNRVFTSPTEQIFAEHHQPKGTSPEKLLKGLRDFLEPLLVALKK